MNILFSKCRDKDLGIHNSRFNVDIHGDDCFGTLYELDKRDMEHLFVFLGEKIEELKGGIHKEAEE